MTTPKTNPKPAGRPLLIMDLETDPFQYDRTPAPFVVGFYRVDPPRTAGGDRKEVFDSIWSDNCIEESISYLASLSRKYMIYAHNGGKFDYLYFASHLSSKPGSLKIINGRIVQSHLVGHEIRDSYAILPFPLRDYRKDEIDYAKLERNVREKHKAEIVQYLKSDCRYLHDLVSAFHADFGSQRLTIGSTAMGEIRKRHYVSRTSLPFDRTFRRDFFYGGRNQCFKTRVIDAPVSIYDVNAMYPDVMRNVDHPASAEYHVGTELTPSTVFVHAIGKSAGCFPVRSAAPALEISFPHRHSEFFGSVHEYRAGVETGTFEPEEIISTWDFPEQQRFKSFVDDFHARRRKYQALGDDVRDLLYKFTLTSCSGKFSQNPANFFDWTIATYKKRPIEPCRHCKTTGRCPDCFKCRALNDYEPPEFKKCMFCLGTGQRWKLYEWDRNKPEAPRLWRAQTFAQGYFNVATGSSITGAARAKLLRGLSAADGPIYCDTDSIITTGSLSARIDPLKLGAWKLEGTGCLSAIAGKKLYAIFTDREPELSETDRRRFPWKLDPVSYRGRRLYCIKKAHKGFNLTPAQILSVAQGAQVETIAEAPAFRLFHDAKFTARTAKLTAIAAKVPARDNIRHV